MNNTPVDSFSVKLKKLNELVQIQSSKGNYDYSEYMRGMANGLICAQSVFTGINPHYIDAPHKVLASRGGKASAAKLTPAERKKRATKASHARKPLKP